MSRVGAGNVVKNLNISVPFGKKCETSRLEGHRCPRGALRPQDVNSEKWKEYRLGR